MPTPVKVWANLCVVSAKKVLERKNMKKLTSTTKNQQFPRFESESKIKNIPTPRDKKHIFFFFKDSFQVGFYGVQLSQLSHAKFDLATEIESKIPPRNDSKRLKRSFKNKNIVHCTSAIDPTVQQWLIRVGKCSASSPTVFSSWTSKNAFVNEFSALKIRFRHVIFKRSRPMYFVMFFTSEIVLISYHQYL